MESIQGKTFVNARAIIERTANGEKQIIVQFRTKRGQECWELPGGTIEPYESLYVALKREVKEETGLDVTTIVGEDGFFVENDVECLSPFSVYQTLSGFVNSIGFHFICHATGELLTNGDASSNIKWVGLDELKQLVEQESFQRIDKVAVIKYLKLHGR